MVFSDESCFLNVTILKRCPVCGDKPLIHRKHEKGKTTFQIVHPRIRLPECAFGSAEPQHSMKRAITGWQTAVTLAG